MIFNNKNKGFSLIEMVVALMIFSIVAVVALGALVKIISTNKKAQTLQDSITNLNFALETMTREMRVGTYFRCVNSADGTIGTLPSNNYGHIAPQECKSSATANTIAFETGRYDSNKCPLLTVYRFEVDSSDSTQYVLKKARQTACGENLTTLYKEVIDSNVAISKFTLTAFPTIPAQPYYLVGIRVEGYAGASQRLKERSYFDIQTAVSPRLKN
jgi:prepilin-type N-terminal cleavage/methylation domain-containing protein